MSRIHEALKKRERERALRDGKRSETNAIDELPASLPEGRLGTEIVSEIPSFASSLNEAPTGTSDKLLERCAQGSWNPQSTMLFFKGHQGSPADEEFRTLRSRLLQMREQRLLRKLLITSPLPNEGKSFVAANLAQVIACQEDRRALLIDGDLRGGRLHDVLGTFASPGLSDYLVNEVDEFKILQRGPIDNLFFVASGRGVTNPAELVANGRLKILLKHLEPLFDWIIIDSPPAIPVSDATLLADYCDGVVLVVRSNVTHPDALRKARQEFRETQLVGAVLNGVPTASLPYYGSYRKTYS
jgi:protein-tyrosine kinase